VRNSNYASPSHRTPTYSGGSGTENDPYLISSKEDMAALSLQVRWGGTGNPYSGTYFLLTTNVTGITTMIGDAGLNRRFSGIFDGGGHTIEVDMKKTYTSSVIYAETITGIFGYLSNATIKNLGMTGTVSVSVTNLSDVTTLSFYTGGICGYARACNTFNCYNIGDVSAIADFNNNNQPPHPPFVFTYAGGLCGTISSAQLYPYTRTEVYNCYNIGNIEASSFSVVQYVPGYILQLYKALLSLI
jgi:hypothetical protein